MCFPSPSSLHGQQRFDLNDSGNKLEFEPIPFEEACFDSAIDDVLDGNHDALLESSKTDIFLAESATFPAMNLLSNSMITSSPVPPLFLHQEQGQLQPMSTTMPFPDLQASSFSSNNSSAEEPSEEALMMMLEEKKPKRSLSAYNLFFKAERQNLLKSLPDRRQFGKRKPRNSHGKMGFAEMARVISQKWKQITPAEKAPFDHLAQQDRMRYKQEMAAWKQEKQATSLKSLLRRQEQQQQQAVPEEQEQAMTRPQDLAGLFQEHQHFQQDDAPTARSMGGFAAFANAADQHNFENDSFVNVHWSHGGNNMFLQGL